MYCVYLNEVWSRFTIGQFIQLRCDNSPRNFNEHLPGLKYRDAYSGLSAEVVFERGLTDIASQSIICHFKHSSFLQPHLQQSSEFNCKCTTTSTNSWISTSPNSVPIRSFIYDYNILF